MDPYEFRLIAGGWFLLILFLTLFWYATLRRLSTVLKERLDGAGGQSRPGLTRLFLFLFRGEFRQSGDERLIAVCKRLRSLLFGYVGAIGAYIVFLALARPHY